MHTRKTIVLSILALLSASFITAYPTVAAVPSARQKALDGALFNLWSSPPDMQSDILQFAGIKKLDADLAAGANVNATNWRGDTPLMMAARNGDADCARVLVAHGANVNAQNTFGSTALESAVKFGRTVCIGVLLDHGASVNTVDSRGTPMIIVPLDGIFFGDPMSSVPTLLNHGANVNAMDNQGRTALSYAILHYNPACVKLLLDHGANVNFRVTGGAPGIDRGRTPLMIAAYFGRADCVQMLLSHGAGVNARDLEGNTAVQLAYQPSRNNVLFPGAAIPYDQRHRDTVKLLIAAGAANPETPKWPALFAGWAALLAIVAGIGLAIRKSTSQP